MKTRLVWLTIAVASSGALLRAYVRAPSEGVGISTRSAREAKQADDSIEPQPLPSTSVAAQTTERLPPSAPQVLSRQDPGALALAEDEGAPDSEGNEEPRPTLGGASRQKIVQALVASGAPDSRWAHSAAVVFADLQRELPRDVGRELEFGKLECYALGCAWDVTYQNQDAYEKGSQDFWKNAKLGAWPGVRARTQLEEPGSGKLVATWLLLTPEPLAYSSPE